MVALVVAPGTFLLGTQEPNRPLEEIVRQFAGKESEYARAHALYEYRLTVRVQELDQEGNVLGEFEQEGEVGFDSRGRRVLRLLSNPRSDLARLGIQRIELEDLERIPLFIIRPEEIPDYDITYLTRERVDEVDTYLFRLRPKGIPRPGQSLFEGIVWVDTRQLDIVKALGRLLPVRSHGALGEYFQRLELFREPVDDYLFTTFIRADDILQAVGGEMVKTRLVVRFTGHTRIRKP